jgi:hypothetical protein
MILSIVCLLILNPSSGEFVRELLRFEVGDMPEKSVFWFSKPGSISESRNWYSLIRRL